MSPPALKIRDILLSLIPAWLLSTSQLCKGMPEPCLHLAAYTHTVIAFEITLSVPAMSLCHQLPPPWVTGKDQLRHCQPGLHTPTLRVSQEHKHQLCLFYRGNRGPGFHTKEQTPLVTGLPPVPLLSHSKKW